MKRTAPLLFLAVWLASNHVIASPPTGRYKLVVDQLTRLQETYSAFSELVTLGANDDGVDIVGIRVSNNPKVADPSKVAHLVVSTHHGNELKAADFTLYWLDQLLKKYAAGGFYRTGLADTEWMVIPVLNVSGYNANNRYEHGTDPNRDYPGPCISQAGGKLKSIRLLMDHLNSRAYSGSLTVHGYVGALTYPWGVNTTNTHSNDHNAFEKVTRGAAQLNGYRYGTSTDIVYPCDGAFEDYAYWKHGIWSLLLELRDGSTNDIRDTSAAIFYYFDGIDSSPSVQNQLTGGCSRAGHLDRHDE